MKRILLVVLLLVIGGQSSDARIPPHWPFDKLVAKSDVVVIIEPIENRPTDDTFPGNRSAANFVATNTWFKVAATLKAPGEPLADLTVVHFGYSANALVLNGARSVKDPFKTDHAKLLDGIFTARATAGRATNAASACCTFGNSSMPTNSPAP